MVALRVVAPEEAIERQDRPTNPCAVFLQGMPCAFHRELGSRLKKRGWRVGHVSLCAGDWLFWHGADTCSYRGRFEKWAAFFRDYCRHHAATHLILLGENRRYHAEAIVVAKDLGMHTWVNDFGYLRPDWITFERDGMSAASRFPREPAAIRQLAAQVPGDTEQERFPETAQAMVVRDLAYNVANLLFAWAYPFYRRSDRRPHTLVYTPASAWRLLGNRLRQRETEQTVARVIADPEKFFLFPLQLSFDFQIVAYSPFRDLREAIDLVLTSFARAAAPDTLLVVKEHPWDPGLPNTERHTRRRAAYLGVATRVVYLRGGALDRLLAQTQGVVTVNSTVGLQALQQGVPLFLLGEAIYDVPGLVDKTRDGQDPGQALDTFWRQPRAPDAQLTEDFVRALAHIQIRGGYFSQTGRRAAVREAASRLTCDA